MARHIPWVWGKTTPQEAIAVRERGSAAALRQVIGELADSPGLVRVADLATRAGVSAPTEGRVLYAGLRALAVPEEPVARLWHAATLLREHRGDGHNFALVAHDVGGTEAHVLMALSLGMRAQEFGRIHHLPKAQLAAVVDGLRGRGLVDAAGGFTDAGRETRQRIEALTDELAAPAYDVLSADELDELIAGLEPIAAAARRSTTERRHQATATTQLGISRLSILADQAGPAAGCRWHTPPPGIELLRLVLFDDETRRTAEQVSRALHDEPIPPGQTLEDL